MAESHASPGTAKLCSQLPGAVEVPEVPWLPRQGLGHSFGWKLLILDRASAASAAALVARLG